MAANIEKYYFLFRYFKAQGQPVTVTDTCGKNSLQFSTEGMEFEVGLKRVIFQIINDFSQANPEIRMFTKELSCAPHEVQGCYDLIHY